MNPAEFLTITSAVLPDRDALVSADGTRRITYEQMAARVDRLATSLSALGVGRGVRVAVMDVNSPEYAEIYYACARLGACFVPLNYRAKREELAYMVKASATKVLFVGQRYLSLVPPDADVSIVTLGFESPGLASYEDLLQAAACEVSVEPDDGDPAAILFTSGTTATPKGVVLTYLNLSLYVLNTMDPADPEAAHEKTLLSVGAYHIAGLSALLSSVWGGRTLTILPQFETETWLEAVQRERITHAFLVPTMMQRLLDEPKFGSYDLSSLQLITYGAAPMPYRVVRRAIEVFKCGLMNAYGQTESTSSLTYLGPEDHVLAGSKDEIEKKLRRLRSVGRAMSDVTIAILDPQGEMLPPGSEGEICASSARVMKEYLSEEESAGIAVADGWLHTGDIGYLDEDGYLFITGRLKDLIIRGGENISPGEIESVLGACPGVAEAAVIGVADEQWGEVVKAIVVRENGSGPSAEEIQAFCRTRLASYKTPSYIAFVDQLPRNPMGKVLKNDLRRDHGSPDNTKKQT